MANILDQFELDGIREDFDNMLGIYQEDTETIDRAKTLVSINRIADRGVFNETTGLYDTNTTSILIYAGPAHISPVTYRRDRQELGGQEAVRIRQYRCIVPWDAGDIWIDDVLTVNFTSDPNMDGKVLDVTDVMYESELAVRRITLTDTTDDGRGENC